jgi:NADH dehydrogenase
MNIENKEKPRVLILGAGFGGLTAAISLAKIAKVTLVDQHNFQTFLPLLYQVSTAGLAADHVAYPIRGALRGLPIEFRMGSPISINHREKSVKLDSSEEIYFDHLIIALGSATADFGIPGVAEHALGMKTIHEALTIRAEVMRRFEDLCRFNDDTKLGIVVVGGGPTGVEMAGALAELIRGPLKGDHAEAAANINISLIEAGDRLLPALHPSLSDRTFRDLEKIGVHVLTNTAVAEVAPRIIKFKDGTQIGAEITIWAAGVRGVPVLEELNIPLNRGRIDSEQTLQVKNYPYIWAIGDNSGSVDENGKHYPMIAPVALQQAKFVAQQISQLAQGKDLKNFKYRDKGAMATIGRHKAVVEVKGLRITGFVAWGIWLFLHLFYLLGGRNKIGTIADWSWNYLTFDRGNRHIMDAL